MGSEDNHFDIIIIGGGSAGYAAARTALAYTRNVAVIDSAEVLGGLCILKGCMPSKTLLYSSEIAHTAAKGKHLGLSENQCVVDVAALQKRKRQLIGEFAAYREKQLTDGRFKLIRSHARFLDHLTIRLTDGTELWADKYVIATGSRVNTPPVPGLDSLVCMTSDEILAASSLPRSIIVLGGGIVACELAQYLNRAGVKVTMIQRNPFLLKEVTPDAARVVRKALEDEGIEVFTETAIRLVSGTDRGFIVHFVHKEIPHFVIADQLFNALGRVPNTSELDLEQADVQLSTSGHIQTNVYQQTTNPAIYAAGDCAGPLEIVHIAIMQGENAVHHALGKKTPELNYDSVVKVVFTDPQIASAGLSRAELTERGADFIEANHFFFDHGKALVMDAVYGYVRIYASRADGLILGAECVGKDASELIHSLAVAVSAGLTVSQLLKVHWYHPTLSEIWTYPLEDIREQVRG